MDVGTCSPHRCACPLACGEAPRARVDLCAARQSDLMGSHDEACTDDKTSHSFTKSFWTKLDWTNQAISFGYTIENFPDAYQKAFLTENYPGVAHDLVIKGAGRAGLY